MVKTVASKVMWVGKATVFLVGLAVILALVFGMASAALGADGDFFKVGRNNLASAVSVLTKNGVGPALSLRVDRGAPLVVNPSAGTATNLSADKLDGKDSSAFAPKEAEAWHEVGDVGQPQFTSSNYICSPGSFCHWRNFDAYHNSAAFFKDNSEVVHLKGLVAIDGCEANPSWCVGSDPFAPTEIFVLPAGYRPARREVQVTISENKLGRATITPDGRVIPEVGSLSFFSLDGITFRAAN